MSWKGFVSKLIQPDAPGLKIKSASHEIVTEMIGDLVKVNESLDYKHVTYEKIKKSLKRINFPRIRAKGSISI